MPKENQDIHHKKGFGFWVVKAGAAPVVYLVRCFECGRENHMPAVAGGRCAWCGYDANKDKSLTGVEQ